MGSLKILKSIWPSTWGSKISPLRYLRADETVDIDTALQEILVICKKKQGTSPKSTHPTATVPAAGPEKSAYSLFEMLGNGRVSLLPPKMSIVKGLWATDCPLSKAFKTLYFLLAGMDSHEHWHHSESRFAIVIFKFSSFGKDISILIHFQM